MADEPTNPDDGSQRPRSLYDTGKAMNSFFDPPSGDGAESEDADSPEPTEQGPQDLQADEDLATAEEVESEELEDEQDMSEGEDAEPEGEETSDEPFMTLTVNGEEVTVDDPDEARSLAQKGAHYTQEMQKLREEQRNWQSEREQVANQLRQQEQQYTQALESLEQTFGAVLGNEQPDWHSEEMQRLRQEKPQEYAELRAQWDQLGAIQAERERVERERQQEQMEKLQEYQREQYQQLEQKKPEWTDPQTRQKDISMMEDYARSLGFKDEELANVVDHRFLLVLHDAARYQQARETGTETAKKKGASKTASPGNGKKVNAGNRKFRKKREALKETGDVRQAGDLLQEIMHSGS